MGIQHDKTLCKKCETCQEFIYQRTIPFGKRKGEIFTFKYCYGNCEVVSLCNWGPSTPRNKNSRVYVRSTKFREKGKREFQDFIKKDSSNVISYINKNPLDNRLKNMREISKQCNTQTIRGDSMFPGVILNSFYKHYSKNKFKRKKHPKKWNSRIKINGKTVYLGSSKNELEAAHKYYTKMKEIGREINKETTAYKKYKKWLKNQI